MELNNSKNIQKLKGSISGLFFYSSLILPLDQSSWEHISFGKLKANSVVFSKNIEIQVDSSSSFLVYPLKKYKEVSEIIIHGSSVGKIKNSLEDSKLKLGLVVPGDKTLSGVKAWFAKEWIKKVYKLAPKDAGIDRLEMFIATEDKHSLGKSRLHPASDLFHERFIFNLKDKNQFKLQYKFKKKIKTMAVWLSADGDDTKSNFQTIINKIELK